MLLPRVRSSRSMIASRTAPRRRAKAEVMAEVRGMLINPSPLLHFDDLLLRDAPGAGFANKDELFVDGVRTEVLRELGDTAVGTVGFDTQTFDARLGYGPDGDLLAALIQPSSAAGGIGRRNEAARI